MNGNPIFLKDGKWILHQDLRLLRSTLNNTRDKRDIAVQERKLLKERIDSLIQNIADEVEMRKNLKKEIRYVFLMYNQLSEQTIDTFRIKSIFIER